MKKRGKKRSDSRAKHSSENVLGCYIKDINKVQLLSREEEIVTARQAAKGNKAARDALIKANLRFVVRVAKKYQGQGLPLADLINEGNIGLIKAVEHFDVDRGFHFISYAVWWIRQSIMLAIAEKSRIIRMPIHWNHKLYQIEKTRQRLQDYVTPGEDISEIALYLGMDEEKVSEMLMIGQEVASLEQNGRTNENILPAMDFLTNENEQSPEEQALNLMLQEEIERALLNLEEKEADILRARYGLGNEPPRSLEEVGDLFQISKEGVRQIENRALKHLREPELRFRLESYVA